MCARDNGGCSYKCVNTEGSFKCVCKKGYELMADTKTCKDADECQVSNGGCQQGCINTEGSRTCTCRKGFVLGYDKVSCQGI